jgi:hypothetical protein
MYIDMTLATSYKPVLVCIAKVCTLMVFHYTSVPMLYVTERYALIVAILYIDKWLAHEYIVDTNSCAAVLAGSLLVHELRDSGVQERLHGETAHNVVLSMLVLSNILVLTLGEHQTIFHMFFPLHKAVDGVPTTPGSSEYDSNDKKPRQQLHTNNMQSAGGHLNTPTSAGPLTCVVGTSILLVILSTCAMPVSTHDPFLNNLRVWSFTALSLTWLYTVNYKDLRYSIVAPFTPCLLRFSCILFLTPTPLATIGIFLMGLCLVATHMWLNKQQQLQYDMFSPDYLQQQYPNSDNVAMVVRDTKSQISMGSVISYRTPSATPENPVLVPGNGKNVSTSSVSSLVKSNSYPDTSENRDTGSVTVPITPDTVDYDSMFMQAMNENK